MHNILIKPYGNNTIHRKSKWVSKSVTMAALFSIYTRTYVCMYIYLLVFIFSFNFIYVNMYGVALSLSLERSARPLCTWMLCTYTRKIYFFYVFLAFFDCLLLLLLLSMSSILCFNFLFNALSISTCMCICVCVLSVLLSFSCSHADNNV